MNILEIEDVIKGLPDQALMQEAQSPSGQMPQFLVVSEIQRRADMRKRFQNQQQEQPQGTIAQQIVQGGIASMGNQQPIQPMPQQGMPQGVPPQGMPPMPPQGMPPAMQQQPPMSPPMTPPMSPPMMPPAQGMAAGGVVRMQEGRVLPYTGGTEAYQNLIDQALMAGGTSRDIEALIGGNPEAQAVYNSMRGPDPQTANIPYGEEFSKSEKPELRTGASNIYKESIFNPERFSRMMEMNAPAYSLVGSGFDLGETIDPVQRLMSREADLKPFRDMGSEAEAQEALLKQKNFEASPFGAKLFTDTRPRSIRLGSDFTPATDFSAFDPITDDFLPYLNPQFYVSGVAAGGNAIEADAEKFGETTRDAPPETTAETIEAGFNTRSHEDLVEQDMMKRPQGPDYSAAKSILDELQAVDYSAFKPDYAGLITEQERRAQKIRDDASKDASAQALIQLGAGLAAGDISSGLSAAGQSVADIKRQARAEAREEEGLARKLQLAQDEAGMQLGLKQAEAERSIQLQRAGMAQDEANSQAKAEVEAYEFEKTFGLSENKLLADIMKELAISERASLSAAIEQWKSLSDAVTEEDVATRNALKSQINSMLNNLEQSRSQLRGQFNIDSAAVPTPQGSSGRFNLIGTRPGQ